VTVTRAQARSKSSPSRVMTIFKVQNPLQTGRAEMTLTMVASPRIRVHIAVSAAKELDLKIAYYED